MPYIPPSIEEEGLDSYLNRTSQQHNGIDFVMFDTMIRNGVNATNLRKAMGIKTYDTIKKYLTLYKKHHGPSTEA